MCNTRKIYFFHFALTGVNSNTKGAKSSISHGLCICKSSVRAKPPYNEHFLEGPVGVHYREVLLYVNFHYDENF